MRKAAGLGRIVPRREIRQPGFGIALFAAEAARVEAGRGRELFAKRRVVVPLELGERPAQESVVEG